MKKTFYQRRVREKEELCKKQAIFKTRLDFKQVFFGKSYCILIKKDDLKKVIYIMVLCKRRVALKNWFCQRIGILTCLGVGLN